MGSLIENSLDKALSILALDVVHVSNLLEREGAKYAKTADLSSIQQYKILVMLTYRGQQSMQELSRNTLVTKQAITGIINRLTNKEFVKTYKSLDDQRVTLVMITDKGRAAVEKIKPHRIKGNRHVFSPLNSDEVNQLSSILQKLITHLNK